MELGNFLVVRGDIRGVFRGTGISQPQALSLSDVGSGGESLLLKVETGLRLPPGAKIDDCHRKLRIIEILAPALDHEFHQDAIQLRLAARVHHRVVEALVKCDPLDFQSLEDAEHAIIAGGGIARATTGHRPGADASVGLARFPAIFLHSLGLVFCHLFFPLLVGNFPLLHLSGQEIFNTEIGSPLVDPGQVLGRHRVIGKLVPRHQALQRGPTARVVDDTDRNLQTALQS